jgi:hypothetical protein
MEMSRALFVFQMDRIWGMLAKVVQVVASKPMAVDSMIILLDLNADADIKFY